MIDFDFPGVNIVISRASICPFAHLQNRRKNCIFNRAASKNKAVSDAKNREQLSDTLSQRVKQFHWVL